MKRNPGTLCRERNRNKVYGKYVPEKAKIKVYQRRKSCKKETKKTRRNSEMENYIRTKFTENSRSPEKITGTWSLKHYDQKIS